MRRLSLVGAILVAMMLGAALPAGASWIQQTTGTFSQIRSTVFNGVSCTSSKFCEGVGPFTDTNDSAEHTLAENWDGTRWTIQTTPHVPDGVSGDFNGVSCTSPSSCVDVGSFTNSADTRLTLAETWDGQAWNFEATPVPTGATSSELNGVSCTAANACIAVGTFTDVDGDHSLAESWDGNSWTLETTPTPTGATSTDLSGVSCTAANACIAVGSFRNGGGTLVTLAEAWNGTHWTLQDTPNPDGATASQLNGVSCTSATACLAVGSGFAEQLSGTSWTLQTIATPHPHTGGDPVLNGVSCVSATACSAVGIYFRDAITTAVAEAWNGTRWEVQDIPITSSNDSSALNSVSCAAPNLCVAGGSFHNSINGDRALAEQFALRWAQLSIDNPNGAIASGLNGVSCTSAKACMAVGTSELSGSGFETYAERWDGTEWIFEATQDPTSSNLDAVSCTSANACTAVGDIVGGGGLVTLAERWNGTSWSTQSTPNPAGATRSFLTAISCKSATSCIAVGFFVTKGGAQLLLSETWNGTTWTIAKPPNPTGTMPQLNGVSCTSATFCNAVGTFTSSGTGQMFAESWNGSHWTIHAVANPTGGTDSILNGVSCTAATACTAVGNDFNGAHAVTVAERWNGSGWTTQTTPNPNNAKNSFLSGVSCTSASSCTAVGSFSKHKFLPFSERWDGVSWKVQNAVSPPGAQSSHFAGVSCASATLCIAVGDTTDSGGTDNLLAEQFS